jgi:hypothetical protein
VIGITDLAAIAAFDEKRQKKLVRKDNAMCLLCTSGNANEKWALRRDLAPPQSRGEREMNWFRSLMTYWRRWSEVI